MDPILNSPEVETLSIIIEEATRSSEEGVKRFVEPAQGTLKRAVSKRHHIVFGRRGSGKSSLLRKASGDLTLSRTPIAFVDLESFKGHSYPDVLLSVLIVTFQRFKEWLDTAAIHPATKIKFWERFFGAIPKKPAFNRKDSKQLATELETKIEELRNHLYSPDTAEITKTIKQSQENFQENTLSGNVGDKHAGIKVDANDTNKTVASAETVQEYRHEKIAFLQRNIIEYQNIFRKIAKLAQTDSFLFLDDLYHIRKIDQPRVLDYFHSIGKGNNLWLKVGTIRHRTQWYVHGNPPIGVKLADDADEINLDLTLEKYTLTKEFLLKILNTFVSECAISSLEALLTNGAVDRLVLASGGVARDFLGVFRKSIYVARGRKDLDKNSRITAEDVNVAAGEYDSSKREELEKDTDSVTDKSRIESKFQEIREFCLRKANANVFLIDKDLDRSEISTIDELVDLRLLHLIRPKITVSKMPGKTYQAYMLDVSQYTGSRKKRDLEELEFWKSNSQEILRRVTLIYNP